MADRFGWIAETRVTRVSTHVGSVVGEWLSDWHCAPPAVDVSLAGSLQEVCWYTTSPEIGLLGLSMGAEQLAAWFLNEKSATDGALPSYTGQRALDDLGRRLWGVNGAMRPHMGELPASIVQPSLGALAYRIEAGGFVAILRLGREVADRIAPVAGSLRPAPGVSLHQVAQAARETIRAELDLGDISLSELRDMKPGDVLLTEAPLDTPARLHTSAAAGPFAYARLGGRHGRRALRLVDR